MASLSHLCCVESKVQCDLFSLSSDQCDCSFPVLCSTLPLSVFFKFVVRLGHHAMSGHSPGCSLGTDRRRLNDDRSSSFSLPFCPLMLDHALTSDSADPLGYRLLLADRRGKVRASGGRHWSGSRRRRARSFRGVRGAVVGVQSVPVDGRRIGRTPGDCAARHLCHHQASLSLLLRHVG